jgi:hypothetical protein
MFEIRGQNPVISNGDIRKTGKIDKKKVKTSIP